MEDFKKQMGDTVVADHRVVTGIFADRAAAERAYNMLLEKGYTGDEINLVMSDETRKKHFSENVGKIEMGTKAAEGTGKGSVIGGTIGAIAAITAAIGTSFIIPGLGILIAGPIAAGLAGAGAGSIAGGIIGALIGAGIPEERAKLYEAGIKKGHIIISVHPHNETDALYLEDHWNTTF